MNTKSILAITLSLITVLTCLKCRGRLPPPVQKSEDIIVFQNVNLVPMTNEKIFKEPNCFSQREQNHRNRAFKADSSTAKFEGHRWNRSLSDAGSG